MDKNLSLSEIEGQKISKVYSGDYKEFDLDIIAPPSNEYFNFEFETSYSKYRVLNPYGCSADGVFWERILGDCSKDFTCLVIEYKTGQIFFGIFRKENDEIIIQLVRFVNPVGFQIPKRYLNKFELLNEKRPYNISISSMDLQDFCAQEIGYSELRNNLVITLNFAEFDLEINSNGQYRKVLKWKNIVASDSIQVIYTK